MLATRANVALPEDLAAAVAARTAADPESRRVRTEEETREAHRQQLLAADRKRFVDGPVLRISLRHMNVQFNPGSLRPLDALGTVYPTLRLTGDWGVLEVSDGALLNPDWNQVTVAAPASLPAGTTKVSGPGWTLELKARWALPADGRKGDYHLSAP